MTEEQKPKKNGYTWEKMDKSWWEGFNTCKENMSKKIEQLESENARLKKDSEENQDLATIAYMQGASKNKSKLAEAKEIINEFFRITQCVDGFEHEHMELVERADAFLKECGE